MYLLTWWHHNASSGLPLTRSFTLQHILLASLSSPLPDIHLLVGKVWLPVLETFSRAHSFSKGKEDACVWKGLALLIMSDRPSDCKSPWSCRDKLPVDPQSSGEALGYQAAVNPALWLWEAGSISSLNIDPKAFLFPSRGVSPIGWEDMVWIIEMDRKETKY